MSTTQRVIVIPDGKICDYIDGKFRKLSYKKLWVKLVERDLKKTELAKMAGISSASLAKLGRGANVTTDILLKICEALDCDISDIVEVVRDDAPEAKK